DRDDLAIEKDFFRLLGLGAGQATGQQDKAQSSEDASDHMVLPKTFFTLRVVEIFFRCARRSSQFSLTTSRGNAMSPSIALRAIPAATAAVIRVAARLPRRRRITRAGRCCRARFPRLRATAAHRACHTGSSSTTACAAVRLERRRRTIEAG